MSDAPYASYRLTPPVDVPAALDQLEIDYLTVRMDRLLVIFRNAVLNIEIGEKTLGAAEQVTIDVLDAAPQSADTEKQLVNQFLDQLETVTETAWSQSSAA
ncbi:hypothetical protein [Natrinema sp. 1APR25-10V2]|uniref:hypothetical protein n=1 Tax=Natrinema sp. 1APR25-10V2 TaxID=2951081 RepID=UPI002874EAD4|nr:hypothetical protein [Natrinema sp. 1APR25-10V2]MDS0476856.1 hypothetical protein [Natrinema sp. 1APR25-10V2]